MQTNCEIECLIELKNSIQRMIDDLEGQKRKVERKIILKGILEKMKNEQH